MTSKLCTAAAVLKIKEVKKNVFVATVRALSSELSWKEICRVAEVTAEKKVAIVVRVR